MLAAMEGWEALGVKPPRVRETVEDAVAVSYTHLDVYKRQSMILNHEQPSCYRDADWRVPAAPENVLVLHTLCVDPACACLLYTSCWRTTTF